MSLEKHIEEFMTALNGGQGDLDAWLECNNEVECRVAIKGAIEAQLTAAEQRAAEAEKDAERYKALRMMSFETIKTIFWDLLPESGSNYRAIVRDERVDAAIASHQTKE